MTKDLGCNTPSGNIGKLREFLGAGMMIDGKPCGEWVNGMTDEQLVDWLHQPDQKKLWERLGWQGADPLANDPSENKDIPEHFLKRGRQPGVAAKLASEEVLDMSKKTGLHPDMLFMHDAMFAEGDKPEDIPLTYKDVYNTPDEWWTDSEIDEQRRIKSRPLNDRVERYLDDSNKVELVA